MIVNKLKEIQLVPESKILKLDTVTKTYQRFDKTVYAQDPFSVPITGDGEAYIEADKFFALLPEATNVDIESNCVKLTLKNKAEYRLPKIDVKWDTNSLVQQFDKNTAISVKLASSRLTSATLKNLANPMLQCIYLDNETAVSCNSMVACIDGTAISPTPILLPPDAVALIEGQESFINVIDSNFIIKIADGYIVCPMPDYNYAETAEILRSSLPQNITKYPVGHLYDEVKRLSAFGEFLSFETDRVKVGENFEPFNFPSAEPTFNYGVQYLLTILPQVTHIAQSEFALLLYGDKFLFMISPESAD